jgi:hypothetical protein
MNWKFTLAMVVLRLDKRYSGGAGEDNPLAPWSRYWIQLNLRRAMTKIKPQQLELRQAAGYHGLVIAANGHEVKVRKYLEIAIKDNMLPGEDVFLEMPCRSGAKLATLKILKSMP